MKLSKPSHFEEPHLIYDPILKGALMVAYDEVVSLPGPFVNYEAARKAMTETIEKRRHR